MRCVVERALLFDFRNVVRLHFRVGVLFLSYVARVLDCFGLFSVPLAQHAARHWPWLQFRQGGTLPLVLALGFRVQCREGLLEEIVGGAVHFLRVTNL